MDTTRQKVSMKIPQHPSLTPFEQIAYASTMIGKPLTMNEELRGTIFQSFLTEDGMIELVVEVDDEFICKPKEMSFSVSVG